MSVLALPPEITETIIVWAVVAGFPTAIASLARTCRHHRAVVYNTSGQHLWREIYLAVFDDPRERRFVDSGKQIPKLLPIYPKEMPARKRSLAF